MHKRQTSSVVEAGDVKISEKHVALSSKDTLPQVHNAYGTMIQSTDNVLSMLVTALALPSVLV